MKKKLKRLRQDNNQMNLFGRTFGQQREEAEAFTELQQLVDHKKFILHLPECDHNCILLLCMDLERYMGRNVPWYLTPQYDFPEYKGCPKAEDYEFGYYGHDLQEGTKQFIRDRCDWVLQIIKKKILSLENVISQSKKPYF